ncbi:MAG: copper homeostasis protein CutC [Saprospiraceae bacterium]|nr:copper homeostasis protein CutC [Saprospiraceae bacterium]
MIIEIAANSLQSALNAQQAGASRIELCAGLEIGGITPGAGLIRKVRSALNIPVFVLVRPRSGDFVYSEKDIEIMVDDIRFCKESGIDGIVSGALTPEGSIDAKTLEILLSNAQGMQFTFHRAFDLCFDPLVSLNTLIRYNVDRILTSGQKNNVVEGRFLIKKLIQESKNRIVVMPGCGVNENNILPLASFTGANEFHASLRSKIKSNVTHFNREVYLSTGGDIDEHDYYESDSNRISHLVKTINE